MTHVAIRNVGYDPPGGGPTVWFKAGQTFDGAAVPPGVLAHFVAERLVAALPAAPTPEPQPAG